MDKKINILGINIDNIAKKELTQKFFSILLGNKFNQIVTVNPEIVLAAIKDEEYFYVINSVDLAPADGIGLKFASFLTGENIHRITGVEISDTLLKICEKENKKVLIVRWEKSLSSYKDIEEFLKNKFPNLNFLIFSMPRARENWSDILKSNEVQNFQPDILFCLFGAPYQEKFIFHIAKKIPNLKIGIGVGGAFDFFTQKIKRAPRIFQVIGLEWLWRLVQEPKRFKRIFNAVIVFPYKFLRWKFVLPFFYRKNIACLLFKKEGNKKYILLVERTDKPGHWQLPQGGTDGQDLITAGKRELNEELNCNAYKIRSVYKNLYKYKFGQRREDAEYVERVQKRLGYKGQRQSLCIAEFTGNDNDIKINFWEHINWKWVLAEKVFETVHESRRQATEIYLKIFFENN